MLFQRKATLRILFLLVGPWLLFRCQSLNDPMRLENWQRLETSLCSFYNVAGSGAGAAELRDFRQQAGPTLESFMRDLRGRYGTCKQALGIGDPKRVAGSLESSGANRVVQITTDQKIVLDAEISLSGASKLEKMRILGIHDPKQTVRGIADIKARVTSLAPRSDFLIWNMRSQARHEPGAKSSDNRNVLAVGSLADLFVLEAVRSAVASGTLKWTDQVEIIGPWKSIPQSGQRDWQIASTASIAELAEAMMLEGDATAADHLLFHLGRSAVERVVANLGASSESRNVPFLARSDLWRMQASADKEWRRRYDAASAGQRRKMLDEVQRWQAPAECQDYEYYPKGSGKYAGKLIESASVINYSLCRPQDIDRRQWFFKPSELCAVVANLVSGNDSEIAKIASKYLTSAVDLSTKEDSNRAASFRPKQYVFESSNPGVAAVVALTLDSQQGNSCFAAAWNHPSKPLDDPRIRSLVKNILRCAKKECKI
jgi:hypothetical protein